MNEARSDVLQKILPAVRQRAQTLDISGDWPADDLSELAGAGVWRWMVPVEFGGEAIDPLQLHLLYERIAWASLATALVISQRDSAVGLIDVCPDSPLRGELLPAMARGECFATIGIAQLTTSRQGAIPALRAAETAGGYRLEGQIPWASGAGRADYIVAGAAIDDGRQILFALPRDLPGVVVHPPMPLVALRASWTARIDCREVELDRRWILRGPVDRVLAGRSRGVPVGQAFLAMGLCQGALDLIAGHDSERARSLLEKLRGQFTELRDQIIDICKPDAPVDPAAIPPLRAAINSLALRITHSAVALYKGTALLADHPAQRLAREAMFLLVWSCPDPVIDCTVDALAGIR